MMGINETPVRTSKNFKINNIELEDIKLPENLKKFENVYIVKENAIITEDVSLEPLTYGIGKLYEQNVYQKANNKMKINAKQEDNVKIVYVFDDENIELVNNIEIEAETSLNIVIEYKSETKKRCFNNAIIKVIAKENAKVKIAIINLTNQASYNFISIENVLYANSDIKYTIIDIGGKNSISNYYSNILGENANNDLKTIYLGVNDEIKDINYIAEIRGKKVSIDIDVQGALKDNAKKHFKGTIDFKKGCKKAKGNENEYCMLLSDRAKSIALPMLLCTEDDVEGNHSTASGKVDEKELFYIMSRGLSYEEAVKLIVNARFNMIIERISDEDIKQEVLNVIEQKLK